MRQQLSFVILSTGPDNMKELRTALGADPRARVLAGGEDLEQFYQEVAHLKPSAAIITVGGHSEAAFALINRCSEVSPDTVVVCAAEDHSSELILRCLRSGAHEFLRLPAVAEELRIIVDRTAAFYDTLPESTQTRGRVTAVFSNKGGCGTSFIAANLAAAMPGRTVIVDLNQQAGGLDLYLGAEPKFSINHLVQQRNQLDETLLTNCVVPLSESLALLSAPREPTLTDEVRPEDVFKILELLRALYDQVVLDPPHTFDVATLAALDQADDVVLVVTLDLPALRCAQSTLATFDRLGYARGKVHVVVNRWSKLIELAPHEVERCLGQRVVGWVPSNYRSVVGSINLGHPLVASDPASHISREIKALAGVIVGGEAAKASAAKPAPPRRRNFWDAVWRRPADPMSLGPQANLGHHALDRASKLQS